MQLPQHFFCLLHAKSDDLNEMSEVSNEDVVGLTKFDVVDVKQRCEYIVGGFFATNVQRFMSCGGPMNLKSLLSDLYRRWFLHVSLNVDIRQCHK